MKKKRETLMKKIQVFTILLLTVFLLFSCAGAPDTENVLSVMYEPYVCDVAVNDKDVIYAASAKRDAEGNVSFELIQPALLYGTEYVCGKDGLSVVYKDLEIPVGDYAKGKITRGVAVWRDMLCPEGDFIAHVKNDNGVRQYVIANDTAEYRFDAKTKAPVLIKSGDITITITNFRLQNDKSSEGAGENIESGT